MAQQPRHLRRKIQPKAKEIKILNTEPSDLQATDVKTLVLDILRTADAFKSALKKLKPSDYEISKYELQKNKIFEVLGDIQNITKLKIMSFKKCQKNKIEEEPSKTLNTQCSTQSSTQSLLSFLSESSSKKLSSPECTRNKSVDLKSEGFSTSKLMSLSTQSLCSIISSQNDYLDDDDDDGGSDDGGKYREFLSRVNCPFCLKCEDNSDSLVEHLDRACSTFKNKKFVKSSECPYSIFQILPNNTFKCNICPNSVQNNLRKYFEHSQSVIHNKAYNKAALHKNYTELIFCASCKTQIPNNASQLLFHMDHEVHKKNRRDQRSTQFYLQKRIQCIYSKEKKFKCLICPSKNSNHRSAKEILQHFESFGHITVATSQGKSRKLNAAFCTFCHEEVDVFYIIEHFNSTTHLLKEEEEEDNNEFELCFYCGFKCSTLNKLVLHLEGCHKFNLIRQKHKESEDRVCKPIEEQKRPTNENTSEKGRCIIVKDYPKILELYHYFNEFGEVLEIEPSGENTVIKFLKEDTVDRILLSSKPLKINGVELKITRKEDSESSNVTLGSSRTAESMNSCPVANNDGSDPSLDNVVGDGNSTVHEDFSEVAVDGDVLGSLFNRASTHLLFTTLRPDCADVLNIALDCEQILKLGKCHSIGFLKCGLTFPVEKITLYCELSNSLIKEQCLNESSTSFTESVPFNLHMCQKCVNLLKNANAFSEVMLREYPFPIVEFYHNKTQKLCTVTFRLSDQILADELRYCLKDDRTLRSFVLIIRFWLSVHRLEIREFEPVIISLILFFLLSSGVVSTSSENFKKKPGHELLNDSVTNKGFTRPYQNIRKENSIREMFENFLLFLNRFDFENMAICLPLVYPVPKTALFQNLNKYLCKNISNPPVWIMDPFLYNNLALDVEKADWDSLLKTVRETINHYHIN